MKRAKFMKRLEALLMDISAEEREAAMQYYNDYFDDAGAENEAQVIAELGSPEKTAAVIKEGLKRENDTYGEFREMGYEDTRFEEKENLGEHVEYVEYTYGQSEGELSGKKEKKDTIIKALLMAIAVIIGVPIAVPLVLAVVGVVLALVFSGLAILGSLVIAALLIAAGGIIAVICGVAVIIATPGFGLVVCGGGLLMLVLGVIGTVAFVKLCIVVFPAVFHWLGNLFHRLFHRRGRVL